MPVLESIGRALPAHEVLQTEVRARAEEVLRELAPELLSKLEVFETTGIRKRHFARSIDWLLGSHGWGDRAEVYREVGLALAIDATTRALEAAHLTPKDVDGIVFVSTTGLATPSLDALLVNALGMRADVVRVPVWGLGCVGGVAGLNMAADLARAHPDRRFLLVSLELCSLAFALEDLSVRAFVANTLFADGCAAALVRGDDAEGTAAIGRLHPGMSHQWPDTEGVMGWDVTDEGLRVVFSRRIPDIVAKEYAPVVERYLKRTGLPAQRHLYHPGGTKVLEAYESALGLPRAALDEARHVLREHGNMSSPTVLFVVDESVRRAPLAPGETALLGALGPGFTASLALLEGLPAR